MFSKLIENTVGKGEIARYKQFLLFPQCFQKACFPGASKGVILLERVNPCKNDLYLYQTILCFINPENIFENIVKKEKLW